MFKLMNFIFFNIIILIIVDIFFYTQVLIIIIEFQFEYTPRNVDNII